MKVWDLPTRLYHWLQALLFVLMCITGFSGNGPHQLFGLTLATLVLWRILWGIWGSQTNRFKHFLRSPNTVVRYVNGKTPHNGAGHNPAGGWMVFIMLSLLATQCFVGMAQAGYFDAYINDDSILYDIDLLTALHLYGAYSLVGIIVLHVSAIVVYSLRGRPLLKAMLTGKQSLGKHVPLFFRSNLRAGAFLAGIGSLFGLFFNA